MTEVFKGSKTATPPTKVEEENKDGNLLKSVTSMITGKLEQDKNVKRKSVVINPKEIFA